jgi:D-serine deaminase-like pyridoxal phosphate-dependent protein
MQNVYHINNIHKIDSPAIAIYPAIIRNNIESALRIGDIGDRNGLRPHVKTFKTLEIVKMMMDQGISKFKCSTISEGEMLGMAGAPDVLIAYQPSSVKAERIEKLRARYPRTNYSCLIDNRMTADMLSQKFVSHPLPVYIDINVGMNRTGISPGEAPGLIDFCSGLKGIQITGIQAYDGHIHEKDPVLRKNMTDAIYDRVKEIQQAVLKQQGIKLNLIFGGSPGFSMYAQKEDVECSPGTFVFWDAGYAANFPDLPFEVAALVITRIVSIVDGHRLCLDLGHKAIGSENPLPRVVFPDIPDVKVVSHSEEHMVVEVPDTAKYRVEDAWYGIPVHICPTIALHQSLCVIENNQYTGDWEIIARNRKISI